MSELSGGARIRHVFVEVYGKGLRELSPQRDVRDDEISTVIKNGAGVSGGELGINPCDVSAGGLHGLLVCLKLNPRTVFVRSEGSYRLRSQ